mgnify:CR=1 FL=1
MCRIGNDPHGPELVHVIDFIAQYFDEAGNVSRIQVSGYHKNNAVYPGGRGPQLNHFYYANPTTGQRAIADIGPAEANTVILGAVRGGRRLAWEKADTPEDPAKPKPAPAVIR